MRVLFTAVTTLIVLGMYFIDQPLHYKWFKQASGQMYDRALIQKSITIEGLENLQRSEVEALLPIEKSVTWWLVNTSIIESKLLQNSRIEKANLHTCDGLRWGCFVISLAERKPVLYALAGQRAWAFGADGGVIGAIGAKRAEEMFDPGTSPQSPGTLVRGLFIEEGSPDVMKARVSKLWEAVQIFETEVGSRVREIELGKGRDANFQFHDFPMQVRAELQSDSDESSPSVLTQAQRLKRLLEELGSARDHIQRVDLGFDKIAVVKADISH